MDKLVSTDWLASELDADDLVVLDASIHLPDAGRDAKAEFEAAHIPGARFMALPRFADPDHKAPGMVPGEEQFSREISALGVSNDSRVVVYDNSAIRSAFRGWYLLTLFGAREVAVLDGGMAKWQAEGRAVEAGKIETAAGAFDATINPAMLRLKHQVVEICETGSEQLVDARGKGRFEGSSSEIRAGMNSGHMPGARNLPYPMLFNENGTLKDETGLREAFEAAGVALDQPITTTCGSGVTASILLFALNQLGKQDIALYDGSWSEWAMDPSTPKATGAAI